MVRVRELQLSFKHCTSVQATSRNGNFFKETFNSFLNYHRMMVDSFTLQIPCHKKFLHASSIIRVFAHATFFLILFVTRNELEATQREKKGVTHCSKGSLLCTMTMSISFYHFCCYFWLRHAWCQLVVAPCGRPSHVISKVIQQCAPAHCVVGMT